jgi:hypothetical protein
VGSAAMWQPQRAVVWSRPLVEAGAGEAAVREALRTGPFGERVRWGAAQLAPLERRVLHAIAVCTVPWAGSGRPAGHPTGPPQIRTCGTPASGSSVHTGGRGCRRTIFTNRAQVRYR